MYRKKIEVMDKHFNSWSYEIHSIKNEKTFNDSKFEIQTNYKVKWYIHSHHRKHEILESYVFVIKISKIC